MTIESKNLAAEIEEVDEISQIDSQNPISSDEIIEDQFSNQPFRVVYQSNNFLLPQIRDLITTGDDVNLRPEYQRRLRWTPQQKSLLIESLLLNVPVPPVFFYENDLARYEVMDGQQRLNAIKEFLNNEFPLRGLQIVPSLNGRTYARLPPRVKRSLDRASISAIILLQESKGKIKKAGSDRAYELRRFVFERLNTGGKRLSAQEIRNAVYGGPFNDQIVKLSRDPVFTRIWGIPPYVGSEPNDYYEDEERQKNGLYKTMGDCQLVLRFFALDSEDYIHGAMKAMLDRCMERNLDCTKTEAEAKGTRFLERLHFADSLFDMKPFDSNSGANDYRPIAGIYDGIMMAVDFHWEKRDELLQHKGQIQRDCSQLISESSGTGRLTGAANTAFDIKSRISLFRDLFSRIV